MISNSSLPKVTAIMCTYRRFQCVERAVNMFLNQDYSGETELIIYNTDEEQPYTNELVLEKLGVRIFNNNTDYVTGEPYTNVGAIRRDALTHATGDYVITWDDDDIYLKHYIRQGIDRIQATGLPFFKPEQSFFYSGNNLRLVSNTMEASIVGDINKVREYGYGLVTALEGLSWYTKARDAKELNEHDRHYIPCYCFNWNDGDVIGAPHKQSGAPDNPNNFENHKEASKDGVSGRMIDIYHSKRMDDIYDPYYTYIFQNIHSFPADLIQLYCGWLVD